VAVPSSGWFPSPSDGSYEGIDHYRYIIQITDSPICTYLLFDPLLPRTRTHVPTPYDLELACQPPIRPPGRRSTTEFTDPSSRHRPPANLATTHCKEDKSHTRSWRHGGEGKIWVAAARVWAPPRVTRGRAMRAVDYVLW
jgi:hypothetical protein